MAKKKATEDVDSGEETVIKDPMAALFKGAGFIMPPASELVEDEKRFWIDTGSYALNAIISGSIYGGIPSDSITAIAGEKATGKTFLTLMACKNFLDTVPGSQVIYFDSEWAVKPYMLEERNIPTNRFYIRRVNTIEDFRYRATSMINSYLKLPEGQRPPMLFVLDSLGMISTEKEIGEAAEAPDQAVKDMTKSQLVRGVFRVLTIKLGEANIPLIVTAHTFEKIGTRSRPGMPPPKEMGGGEGLKYAASTIVFLSKKGIYDEATKEVTGNELTAKLYKSRYTRESMKTSTILDHIAGLDRYHGLFTIAKDYGVVTKKGNGFLFPDGQFGYTQNVIDNPDKYFPKETLALIEEKVQAAFKYGGGITEKLTTEDEEGTDD